MSIVTDTVVSAMGLIQWLSDEIEAATDYDIIQSRNADIWRVACMIREASNGSMAWESAEKEIISIRRGYEE